VPPEAQSAAAGEPPPTDGLPRWAMAGVAAAVVAGVTLRLYTASPLWLDEALTVNLARLPLGQLTEALKHDGAPPLYYLLLHGWMRVAGTGDTAVRLLSAVFSVATLPLAHRMARHRTAGSAATATITAAAALVIAATSPFAIRYATEARMYSLVALLVSMGWLGLAAAMERVTLPRLTVVAGSAGLLLLTHYWGFYLVGATFVALVVARRWAPAVAVAVGSAVLFAPWLPAFAYQLQHTGTPWGTPPGPIEVAFTTLVDLGGGPHPEGQLLAGLLAALAVLALFGRPVDARRVELDLRTVPGVRADALVGAAALLAGVAVGVVTASAWASRYTSIAFPLVVLVAAVGVRAFADRRVVAGMLALVAVAGVVGGVRNVVTDRTQAGQVRDAIVANVRGGPRTAAVVYCPDQLGPDVHRLVGDDVADLQVTFPALGDPRIVDWVDYERRMSAADPRAFARQVLERAAGRDIFYVWMPGYRTLDKKCEAVNDALGAARPGNRQLLEPDKDTFERQALWLHPATP
jgi:mannosyltransferase